MQRRIPWRVTVQNFSTVDSSDADFEVGFFFFQEEESWAKRLRLPQQRCEENQKIPKVHFLKSKQ